MNIIFFGVGGVLSSDGTIDPVAAASLFELADQCDASLVCLARLGSNASPERINRSAIDATPDRGAEITQWLDEHPDCRCIGIIDTFSPDRWRPGPPDHPSLRISEPAELITLVRDHLDFLLLWWKVGQTHKEIDA